MMYADREHSLARVNALQYAMCTTRTGDKRWSERWAESPWVRLAVTAKKLAGRLTELAFCGEGDATHLHRQSFGHAYPAPEARKVTQDEMVKQYIYFDPG
jgi:hypothetical protein